MPFDASVDGMTEGVTLFLPPASEHDAYASVLLPPSLRARKRFLGKAPVGL